MSIFTKIGCALIGWDAQILAECGEASKRQFRKLLSAICIMMVIWGTIGFCFAANYMDVKSVWGRAGVALAFMLIILCIERVIILRVGKNWVMTLMRGALAVFMAILGSTIFDQLMFRSDLHHEIEMHRTDEIAEMVSKRASEYNAAIERYTQEKRQMSLANDSLYEDIKNNPAKVIPTTRTERYQTGVDENGKPVYANKTITENVVITNPSIEQVKTNNTQIEKCDRELQRLQLEKEGLVEKVTEEVQSRPVGFIEELEATVRVISRSWVSLGFYAVMFLFLMSLEMFVLSIRSGEEACDYDLIVEHQLNHKKMLIEKTEQSMKN